jgi:hypothetical protein
MKPHPLVPPCCIKRAKNCLFVGNSTTRNTFKKQGYAVSFAAEFQRKTHLGVCCRFL